MRLVLFQTRLVAVLLALLVPVLAWAGLPKNNKTGEFWRDQWTAAEIWYLPPHIWGVVFAILMGIFTLWVLVKAIRNPRSTAPENPPDWDRKTHRRYLRWTVAGLMVLYAAGFAANFSVYDDPQNIWLNDVVTDRSWEHIHEVTLGNHRAVNQEWMFTSLMYSYWWAETFAKTWSEWFPAAPMKITGKYYASFFWLNWFMFGGLLLLVHRLAHQMFDSRKIALLATLFMGLSPITVELVHWMLERGHFFGLLWALSACVAYFNYLARLKAPSAGHWAKDGLQLFGWLFLSLFCYAMSQYSKPVFLYVPLWIVLFDFWTRRPNRLLAVAEKVPWFMLFAFFLWRITDAGGSRGRMNDEYIGGSIWNTLAIDANHVLEYMRFSVFPTRSGLHVPWYEPASWQNVTGIPDILILGFPPIASLAILGCLLLIGILMAWRWKWPMLLFFGVAGVFSVGTVMNLPTSTIVIAYRYTLSMNVLASILLAAAAWHSVAPGAVFEKKRWVAMTLTVGMLALGAAHTVSNIHAWRTPRNLWVRNAEVLYPHDGWAHYYAGKTLQHEKEYELAYAHELLAQEYLPANEMSWRRIGDAAYQLGIYDEAARAWGEYFDRRPNKITDWYRRKFIEIGHPELDPSYRPTEPEEPTDDDLGDTEAEEE